MPLLNVAHPGRFQIAAVWTPETLQGALLRNHHAFLKTRQVETLAVAARTGAFSVPATSEFVKAVCVWGNYAGIWGKVLGSGRAPVVASTLASADAQLTAGNLTGALASVRALFGLGQVSFASKNLRMLAPDRAVVLDSLIQDRLGYPATAAGYLLLVDHCRQIRDELNTLGAINPTDLNGSWRLCDVEMALFAVIRGL